MRSNANPSLPDNATTDPTDWELRPGGMLVQKLDAASAGPPITVNVAHGPRQHRLSVPSQSTFGELKRALAAETGLEPPEQRLLFRGKEKDDAECLHMAGVKDSSKLLLLEVPASEDRKLEEISKPETETSGEISKACEAVASVRAEVDKLAEKVSQLESAVREGTKVADKEFVVLTELLMMQLLKLDSIEAEGEAKVQRRIEVHRIQNYVETLDTLKARNSNPISNDSNITVTTEWGTFESGCGSLTAPRPMASTTKITSDWENFD